ncbi:MAG: DNA polymerase III subunit epsilon [Woeseia sp.]|nr:DNA polymerase III subunit epsilon [Woeseia sp.]|tara:strand:- start:10561 stop:11265 length:705 start_codon:yes stop_codon:yes gene_type:complete
MRQIVLDTETTGLSIAQGHRIIEIGCIELVNRRLTGKELHFFINPDRDIDAGAEAIHGITRADLENKPRFEEIIREFLDFIKDAELIIHNASFDVGFLDHELKLMALEKCNIEDYATVLDTLSLARKMHPGQRNSLDALCKRYQVDASKRHIHGALIDSELLAHVYLAMTGGQTAMLLDEEISDKTKYDPKSSSPLQKSIISLKVTKPDNQEINAHNEILEKIRKSSACIWDFD